MLKVCLKLVLRIKVKNDYLKMNILFYLFFYYCIWNCFKELFVFYKDLGGGIIFKKYVLRVMIYR